MVNKYLTLGLQAAMILSRAGYDLQGRKKSEIDYSQVSFDNRIFSYSLNLRDLKEKIVRVA